MGLIIKTGFQITRGFKGRELEVCFLWIVINGGGPK